MNVELRHYRQDDFWILEALETDPDVMRHLGGPTPCEKLPKLHEKRLVAPLYFTIVAPEPAGTIGIWPSDWKGESIQEMGWMVLPAFQGRGIATAAGRRILEHVRGATVHAFPAVSNEASNAICRKLGFTKLEETDIAYNGPPRRHVHWRIDL